MTLPKEGLNLTEESSMDETDDKISKEKLRTLLGLCNSKKYLISPFRPLGLISRIRQSEMERVFLREVGERVFKSEIPRWELQIKGTPNQPLSASHLNPNGDGRRLYRYPILAHFKKKLVLYGTSAPRVILSRLIFTLTVRPLNDLEEEIADIYQMEDSLPSFLLSTGRSIKRKKMSDFYQLGRFLFPLYFQRDRGGSVRAKNNDTLLFWTRMFHRVPFLLGAGVWRESEKWIISLPPEEEDEKLEVLRRNFFKEVLSRNF